MRKTKLINVKNELDGTVTGYIEATKPRRNPIPPDGYVYLRLTSRETETVVTALRQCSARVIADAIDLDIDRAVQVLNKTLRRIVSQRQRSKEEMPNYAKGVR